MMQVIENILTPDELSEVAQAMPPVGTAQLTEAKSALSFIFGGKATFTLRSLKTGDHITFKVTKAKDKGDLFFIKARRNTDAEGGFNYLAYFSKNTLRTSKKSKPLGNALTALEWTLGNLMEGRLPSTLQVWHEGKCAKCGRALTDPDSLARGFGPECWKKGTH